MSVLIRYKARSRQPPAAVASSRTSPPGRTSASTSQLQQLSAERVSTAVTRNLQAAGNERTQQFAVAEQTI